MKSLELIGMLAQAETQGNPILGFLILGGVIWFCVAVFGKQKAKYLVTNSTSVRKVK